MIKSQVLKDFFDIQQEKKFRKNDIHFTKSLKRAEELVQKGFLKILEIEKAAEKPKKKKVSTPKKGKDDV